MKKMNNLPQNQELGKPGKSTRALGAVTGAIAGLPLFGVGAPITGIIGYKYPGAGMGMLAGGTLGTIGGALLAKNRIRALVSSLNQVIAARAKQIQEAGGIITSGEKLKAIKEYLQREGKATNRAVRGALFGLPLAAMIAGGIGGAYIERKLRQKRMIGER